MSDSIMNTADYWGLNKCGIPERMHGGIIRYVVDHQKPGDFLCAIFQNKLVDAFGRADDENEKLLKNYADWLYNYAPGPCWGSPQKMAEWLNA